MAFLTRTPTDRDEWVVVLVSREKELSSRVACKEKEWKNVRSDPIRHVGGGGFVYGDQGALWMILGGYLMKFFAVY